MEEEVIEVTVISNVKATLANIQGIQASFSKLALTAMDVQSKQIFHECMMEMEPMIKDLKLRIEFMESEESQYKNS